MDGHRVAWWWKGVMDKQISYDINRGALDRASRAPQLMSTTDVHKNNY